jgi:polyisoprenoid-binding protein YceI
MRLTAVMAATCLTFASARAADRLVPLTPPTTRIGYTVFAWGLWPITGSFDRFRGLVTQDQDKPAVCRIDVTVDIDSLRMEDPDRRQQSLGPDMFDAAHYPTMRFAGHCAPQSIVGTLTLHGISRAVTLAAHREGSQVICAGTLRRRDFGIVGMSGMVAPYVHIRLCARLPIDEKKEGQSSALDPLAPSR